MALEPWPEEEPHRFAVGLRNGLLASAAIWGLIALLVFLAIKLWADTPIVYKSWKTQQCVRVVDPAEEHTCDNLPDKYELKWVE